MTESCFELGAAIAHEVKTPLMACHLLVRSGEGGSEKIQEPNLQRIYRRVAECREKLVLLARLEQGAECVFEPVADVVARVATRIRDLSRLLGRSLAIEVAGSQLADAELVPGGAVDAILNCLVANAAEAIGDGAGSIRISMVKEKGVVGITVADSGPGFHDQDKERVFKLGASSRQGARGTGLHISRMLAIRLGGALDLSADPPSGFATEFRLLLPPPASDWGRRLKKQDYPTGNCGVELSQLGEIAGYVAHKFRGQLGGIAGSIQMSLEARAEEGLKGDYRLPPTWLQSALKGALATCILLQLTYVLMESAELEDDRSFELGTILPKHGLQIPTRDPEVEMTVHVAGTDVSELRGPAHRSRLFVQWLVRLLAFFNREEGEIDLSVQLNGCRLEVEARLAEHIGADWLASLLPQLVEGLAISAKWSPESVQLHGGKLSASFLLPVSTPD